VKKRYLQNFLGALALVGAMTLSNLAHAGFIEVGASGNYRKFFVDEVGESLTLTQGSVAACV